MLRQLYTAISTAVRRCQELASLLFAVPYQADFMLRRIKEELAGLYVSTKSTKESVNV
jgi:hypothetical protein